MDTAYTVNPYRNPLDAEHAALEQAGYVRHPVTFTPENVYDVLYAADAGKGATFTKSDIYELLRQAAQAQRAEASR